MTDFLKEEKERIARINAETAHDFHRIEFREMCAQMIDEALRQHDQDLQVNVQTTLNGRPVTMNGLVSDIKQQITSVLQKAFRR